MLDFKSYESKRAIEIAAQELYRLAEHAANRSTQQEIIGNVTRAEYHEHESQVYCSAAESIRNLVR